MGVAETLDLIAKGGVVAVLGLILWAFLTERIIPRGRLDDATRREAQFRLDRTEAVDYNRKAYRETLEIAVATAKKLDRAIASIDRLSTQVHDAVDRFDRIIERQAKVAKGSEPPEQTPRAPRR